MGAMTKAAWAGLIAVFLVGAAARVGWVAARHGGEPDVLSYPDEEAYRLAGRSLAAGTGLVDEFGYRATYMPAYPAFIAVFEFFRRSTLELRLCQAVLAALVGPLTFLLARQWYALLEERSDGMASTVVALLAGLAAALDPFLIFFSGLLLTEAMFTVFLVAAWWLAIRLIDPRRTASFVSAALAGACVLGCVMLRPSATILIAIVPAVVLACRRFRSNAIPAAALMVGVVVAGLSPWAARNAGILGEWRWTTTRGGISLYDGLQFAAGGASDLAHTKLDPAVKGMDELRWDRYWRERAIDNVRREPLHVLALGGRKCLRMWNIVPNEPEHRRGAAAVISAAWMTFVLVTAVVGWRGVRRAGRKWLVLLVPVAAFTLLHMVFVGSVRYRIPLMPFVFVLSAAGLAGCVFRVRPSPASAGRATAADGKEPEA